ncbi:helix-turn-helix transcriptional regulator [Thermomicrobium sp. 4228-Ro]|uniref:response regulator transcription factor n=1 Tax=Thermomicrobium sp. 4228-Ro TaxID=2993937 RepID=UPI002B060791|nr:helix-turn-helix transcriptional regulator [Thermomicrobium sp. 4228-Ro]
MREPGRAALGLGLVFAWLLLVPLGPAAGAATGWVSGAAVAHGLGLLVAGWTLRRWGTRLWPVIAVFGAAALVQALWPAGRGAFLVVAGALAAVPVLACAGALAALSPRQRPWAVAAGAALANLPLLVLHAGSSPLLLRAGAVAAALIAVLGGWLVRPATGAPVGPLPPRLVAAVGATYLVGGITYGLVLPGLGGNPLGVVPYLVLLGVAAWLADRLGRGTTIRIGLAALGLAALGWGLGWSLLGPLLAALLVGCWAFVDVGWWARLGDEPDWPTSYGAGLAAMAAAIGLGLVVTPLLGGVHPPSGAALALAALLGAALLLPGEVYAQPSVPVSAEPRQPVPGAAEPERPADPAPVVRLSPRERRVLELVARGASNKEIAQELGVSEATVRTHLERLYRKLGVRSRTEAAAWYWRMLAREMPEAERERQPRGGARE